MQLAADAGLCAERQFQTLLHGQLGMAEPGAVMFDSDRVADLLLFS